MASEVRIDRLEDALSRLAQAQAHTDESMRRLAVAQERTEERVGRLDEAMAALLEGQRQLAAAQGRTEAVLQQLARQVGGLSETVGGRGAGTHLAALERQS